VKITVRTKYGIIESVDFLETDNKIVKEICLQAAKQGLSYLEVETAYGLVYLNEDILKDSIITLIGATKEDND
jgi:hypothetical protein